MWSHKVFSVFDSKAKAWLPPFICPNAAVAIRSFEAAANSAQHEFHRFATDFILFEVGAWSESTGELLNIPEKVSLGIAVEFLKVNEVK